LALAADGAQLWVTNEKSASISVISTASLDVMATLTIAVDGLPADGITPVGMVLAPDGRTMYVALGRANKVAFVDVATRQVRALVPVGRRAWALALTADGSRLFVAGGLSNDLTAIDTATAQALKTIAVGQVPNAVLVDD
ncbi:MAG TPA: hypothetical protein VES00_22635, partial [Burkholderiaceae bacterium]|nr:hypothetical protein [Burkholderiaceae bacterium]